MPIAFLQRAPGSATVGGNSEATPPPAPDAEARRLALGVAQGDERAFEELYDRYHERVLRLLLVLSRGDETLAHEVAQSAMLTAAAKLRPVETEMHLWHWLARVARQHLLKAWRQRRREPVLVQFAEIPEAKDAVEPDRMLEESLDAALLGLEEEDRQLIEWFYFEGLSHKGIAERLETTAKAISSRLERARSKLRLLLKRNLSHES